MATIEKRQGKDGKTIFRVKVRRKGYTTQTASFSRLTDAKAWAQGIEADIQRGRHFPELQGKKHTLGETIDRYIEYVRSRNPKRLRDISGQMEWWKEQLGALTLSELTRARISSCLDSLEIIRQKSDKAPEQRRSPATINRYAAALSHCLGVAVREWEWMQENPFRLIKRLPEPRGRTRYLSEDEMIRLLLATEKASCRYLYTIVVLAISTGARKSEILSLRWENVDLKAERITFPITKNGEIRTAPIKGKALAMLIEHNKIRRIDSSLVFPSPDDPSKPFDIRRSWESSLKRADIQDFCFHDLRHTAASYLARCGATPLELSELLGHKSLQMVKRYAHMMPGHTDSIVNKMTSEVFGI